MSTATFAAATGSVKLGDVRAHLHSAADILTGGALRVAQVPNLDGAKFTSGTLHQDRFPSVPASKITSGTFSADRFASFSVPWSKVTGDLTRNLTMNGHIEINNVAPTISMGDTDGRSAHLHVNSSRFYILDSPANGVYDSWAGTSIHGLNWPMEMEMWENGRALSNKRLQVITLKTTRNPFQYMSAYYNTYWQGGSWLDNKPYYSIYGETIVAGAIMFLSDVRTKKNIVPLDSSQSMEIVNQLRPVEYKMQESEQVSYGFLAHEVMDKLKDSVSVGPNFIAGQVCCSFVSGCANEVVVRCDQEKLRCCMQDKTRVWCTVSGDAEPVPGRSAMNPNLLYVKSFNEDGTTTLTNVSPVTFEGNPDPPSLCWVKWICIDKIEVCDFKTLNYKATETTTISAFQECIKQHDHVHTMNRTLRERLQALKTRLQGA